MATPAVRNNNPGNIKDPATGTFKQFATPQEGYAALLNDLEAKKTGHTSTGLTPTSTLVDFAKTYAPPGGNNNSAKYAADLANQMGVRPDTPIGQLDTGKWAAAVAHNEDNSSPFGNQTITPASQVASVTSSQPSQGGFVTPPPMPADTGLNTAIASTDNSAPESTLGKALDVGKTVGNFLFPIAGDLYHDVKGDSTKTGLQQFGDTALSALGFIPGLGEVGEGARAAELAAKGLEAAKGAEVAGDAIKGSGILSKITGSTVARNAGVGYGAGVAQNLSQGKSIGDSIGPNLNTIGGGLLGGAGGLLGKALGGVLDKATGIAPNVKPVLANLSDPKLYDEYTNVAAQRAANIRNPSVLEHAADYADNAVGQIQSKLRQVGEQVGAIKTSEGMKPLAPVTPVLKKFAQDVEDRFGKTISVDQDGTIALDNAPGRVKNVLSSSDETRIKTALGQILDLNKGGNVRKASDVLDNLDGLVDYSKKDLLGNSNDPIEGFLKSTRHNLNDVVGQSSPALAEAKSRFSQLSDSLESIKGAGGANLQRAELLLKRVFSGDQSAKSREIFDLIKKETGIDLTEHAVLAKHFVDNAGDESEKSALQKMLEESSKGGGPTVPGLLLSGGKAALNATIANPIKQGRRIVTGKPGLLNSILRNNAIPGLSKYSSGSLTKSLLQAGRGTSNLIGQ